MANPRRSSYSTTHKNLSPLLNHHTHTHTTHKPISNPNPFNPQTLSQETPRHPFFTLHFSTPHLGFFKTHHHNISSSSNGKQKLRGGGDDEDHDANLVRFGSSGYPSPIVKDKRGWMLDPIAIAQNAHISDCLKVNEYRNQSSCQKRNTNVGCVSAKNARLNLVRPWPKLSSHLHNIPSGTILLKVPPETCVFMVSDKHSFPFSRLSTLKARSRSFRAKRHHNSQITFAGLKQLIPLPIASKREAAKIQPKKARKRATKSLVMTETTEILSPLQW